MLNKKLEFGKIEYLAFEGGGAMGAAYIGALCALQDLDKKSGNLFPGLKNNNGDNPNNDTKINESCIKGISGSSIGAIIALCVSLGYTAEEINVRLITDKAFSILGKEDYMSDITRYYKPKHCKPETKNTIDPKSNSQNLLGALTSIGDWSKKKILKDLIDLPVDLFSSLSKHYILTSFENPEFFTNSLYRIIGESLYENRSKIYTILYSIRLIDLIPFGSEDSNLMPFFRMFRDEEQVERKMTVYIDWIENRRWNEIENTPSKTAVKDFTIIALSIIILTFIAYILISKLFEKKDKKKPKGKLLYQVSMLLRSFNLILSAVKSNQIISLTSILGKFKKSIDDGDLFELATRILNIINSESGNSFVEKMEAFAENIWKTINEPTIFRVLKSLFSRGGIFPGETIDILLAELIYSKVEVTGEGSSATFKKRLVPYDFTKPESRKTHPLFNEKKLIRKANNRSDPDNDWVNEKADRIYNSYKDYYNKLIKSKRKNVRKNDRTALDKYWKDIVTIINHFTFEKFHEVSKNKTNNNGINLVVTGTNILQGVPVYFNYSLTPSFPVTKAVGISSCFPIVFRPILVQCYEEDVKCEGNYSNNGNSDGWVKNNKEWYQANYNGWFIDGGWLNNFPINAFNYHDNESFKDLSPLNMINRPPCSKVLSFRLGGVDIEGNSKQEETYNEFIKDATQYNSPSLGKFFSMMLDSIMIDSTKHQILNVFEENQQVISLYTGYISVLDMTIAEKHLIDVDAKAYAAVMKRFPSVIKELNNNNNINDELIKRLKRDKKESREWRKTHRNLTRVC